MSSGSGQVVWMPGGVRTEIHLRGDDTDGALTVLVDHPPEGWSLAPHRHRHESETIHVIAGHFEMDVSGERRLLGPGDTLFVPAGEVHSGRLLGGVGHRVVTFTPGGIDRFFTTVGTTQPGAVPDLRRVLDAAETFGWDFLQPGRPVEPSGA